MNEEIMPPEDNLEIAIDEAAKNLAPTRSSSSARKRRTWTGLNFLRRHKNRFCSGLQAKISKSGRNVQNIWGFLWQSSFVLRLTKRLKEAQSCVNTHKSSVKHIPGEKIV